MKTRFVFAVILVLTFAAFVNVPQVSAAVTNAQPTLACCGGDPGQPFPTPVPPSSPSGPKATLQPTLACCGGDPGQPAPIPTYPNPTPTSPTAPSVTVSASSYTMQSFALEAKLEANLGCCGGDPGAPLPAPTFPNPAPTSPSAPSAR